MRNVGLLIDGLPDGTLECLHIGGGAFTLARYLAHARPGSRQVAFEPDGELVEVVRERFGLAGIPRLRVLVCDGRTGLREWTGDAFDLVVLDAYAGRTIPPELTTAEFAADVARMLHAHGSFVANIVDGPGLTFAQGMVASVREVLPHMLLLADQSVLGGRVRGHIVLAATVSAGSIEAMAAHVARQGFPRLLCLHGPQVETFRGGAEPLHDVSGGRI